MTTDIVVAFTLMKVDWKVGSWKIVPHAKSARTNYIVTKPTVKMM